VSTVLITGGAGFVGTNAAVRMIGEGHRVRVLDNLSRAGVEDNLSWLTDTHGDAVEAVVGDVRDPETVRRALEGVDSVLHFAAQVAVTTSLDDPAQDASVNLFGTLNLLECVRDRPHPPSVLFTSTNKVYGNLEDVALREHATRYVPADAQLATHGISEQRPLHFCTPYGCSKGAADQYVLDWSSSFRIPTVVFRMSCIYGPHQYGTEDQGWVAHFLIRALAREPLTFYGDGKQVRDILYVDDLTGALSLARADAERLAGRAFNIGGGPGNSVSLIDVIGLIGELDEAGAPEVRHEPWRQGDQRYYVSDTSAFTEATGWRARVEPRAGMAELRDWLISSGPRAGATA
jgi:CDP-paratose 2-epimerase